jgi:peroxiredoxin
MPRFVCLVLLLVLTPCAPAAAPPPGAPIGTGFDQLTLTTLAGTPVPLADIAGKKATVLVFLSFDCPMSNSYLADLSALARRHDQRDVAVLGVVVGEPAGLAKAHQEYKVGFPLYRDLQGKVATALHARVTPQAFVLDARQVLRYSGRIDDRFAARLREKARVRSFDLQSALDDVLAGRTVRVPRTVALGCPLDVPRPAIVQTTKVTYHRDVAPILQKHCQSCHRPGEIGPFALLTYPQARRWARDIKQYTRNRSMPPWMPVGGVAFHGERRLTEKEVAVLSAWADGGAPEGNSKDGPPPLKWTDGWRLGKPDLVLRPSEAFHVGATGLDHFRCFVLPTELKENQWIVAFDVRPGSPRIVHHTLHYFDLTGMARSLERREQARKLPTGTVDRGPGYPSAMGVGFIPPEYVKDQVPQFGALGGWAPGQLPQMLPRGAGMFLPKGSDFILQVHYHRDGKLAADRTQVGLYFARKSIEQPYQTVVIEGLKPGAVIPAGQARHRVRASVWLHNDSLLHDVMPHMHLLGRSVKVTLTPPGGKPMTLVDIPRWDYRWQETYRFRERLLAKVGSKLEVEGVFDNSKDNPHNPNDPPRPVSMGQQTTDEMLYAFIGATSTKKPWAEVVFRDRPPGAKEPALRAGPAMKVLARRLGEWTGEIIIRNAEWTPFEGKLKSQESVTPILGGRFIEERGKSQPGGGQSKLLATWDAALKTYRFWYFDSEGLTSEATGKWDEKKRTLTWTSTYEGGSTATSVWKFVDDDTFTWDLLAKDKAGKVLLDMSGTSKRKK